MGCADVKTGEEKLKDVFYSLGVEAAAATEEQYGIKKSLLAGLPENHLIALDINTIDAIS